MQGTFNPGGPQNAGPAEGERMKRRKNRIAGMFQMSGHDQVGGGKRAQGVGRDIRIAQSSNQHRGGGHAIKAASD